MVIIRQKHVWLGMLIAVFFCGYCRVDAAEQVILTNKISSDMQIALGKTDATYVSRIKCVHQLGKDLNQDEKNAVYDFLEKKPESENLPLLEFNGIKNELVIVLMQQNEYPYELTEKLVKMYKTPELGAVWHDYCIQFLGQWGVYTESAQELAVIVGTLKEALKERNNGIAGTALIAMKSLYGKPGISDAELKDAACYLAMNDSVADAARIPALQIGATMGDLRVRDISRKIIAAKNPAMLKMSAMAALGMVGEQDDLVLLQKYVQSSDVRLRSASAAAIKALNGRGIVLAQKSTGN